MVDRELAVGQADYCLEQVQGSVTRAGAVASGVEDYYLRGAEASGTWIGDGMRALGVGGVVDALRLDREYVQESVLFGYGVHAARRSYVGAQGRAQAQYGTPARQQT
ncbi:MAG TPA: hypothetical protein VNS09_06405 [Solirubrobacter sp.]|nr:hypothetical protein [Solirubrobacter sp.]